MSEPLMFGTDPQLLRTRQAVLASAGVFTTLLFNVETMSEALRDGEPGLVILCHSLDRGLREWAITLIRQHAASAQILVLNGSRNEPAPPGCHELDALKGPGALIQTVQALVKCRRAHHCCVD